MRLLLIAMFGVFSLVARAEEVDLELVLLADASGSIEYEVAR